MTYWRTQSRPPMPEAHRRHVHGPLVSLHDDDARVVYFFAFGLAAVVCGLAWAFAELVG